MTNKDELKRSQKLKREHRRTRVIRTGLNETTDIKSEPIEEVRSTAPGSPFENIATPDDKNRDPDWRNTPLRFIGKRPKTQLMPRKVSEEPFTTPLPPPPNA